MSSDNVVPNEGPASNSIDLIEGKPAPAFCSLENLKVAQVQLVGGLLNGYSVGFVGVYAYLYLLSTDCSRYTSVDSCDRVPNAECQWNAAQKACGWRSFTCEWNHKTESECLSDNRCDWKYGQGKCMNPIGFRALDSGLFAGAMILGCMVGSFFAGAFASRVGFKISFLTVGIVSLISSIMFHTSAAFDVFWVLCLGRLLVGIVLGLVCVACPMYVDQNVHPKHSKVVGVLYQVFGTIGNSFSAVYGLIIGQTINYAQNPYIIWRMEAYVVFTTIFSVLMILLGIFVAESKTKFGTDKNEEKKEGQVDLDANEYSIFQMLGPLAMGVVIASTLQWTGINAVMNYAPAIMGSFGMEPLVGNCIVMLWSCTSTLLAIPLARFFSMRHLFLVGSLLAACSCLFLCGIPVYPGVAATHVKNNIAIAGITFFIATFGFGVGPCFFVLAQDIFPPSFRPKGCSFVMMTQFLFNLIINVGYPVTTQTISGGPSGNQDLGQSVAFIFFGTMGLICFVIQVFFLFPWEDKEAKKNAEHSSTEGHAPE